MVPISPKRAPRRPTRAPRRLGRAPRRPKPAEDGLRGPQDGPKTAQEGSKTAPRRPQDGPRGAQEASKTAPGRLQEPSWLPDLSREPPGSLLGTPRTLPEGLWRPLGMIFMSKCKPPTRTKKQSRVQSRQFPSSIPYQQIPKVLLTHRASLGAGGRGRSPSDITYKY